MYSMLRKIILSSMIIFLATTNLPVTVLAEEPETSVTEKQEVVEENINETKEEEKEQLSETINEEVSETKQAEETEEKNEVVESNTSEEQNEIKETETPAEEATSGTTNEVVEEKANVPAEEATSGTVNESNSSITNETTEKVEEAVKEEESTPTPKMMMATAGPKMAIATGTGENAVATLYVDGNVYGTIKATPALSIGSTKYYFVKPNEPSKDNCVFLGWYTAAEGGSEYDDFGLVNRSSNLKSVDLYAHFKERPHITYHVGETTNTAYAKYLGSSSLGYTFYFDSLETPSKKGYTFDGWYTAENGGEEYTDFLNASADLANVELFAHFTAITYTVEFDKGDGSGSMDDQTFIADETKALSKCTFTKAGYEFDYWQRVNFVGIKLDGTYTDEQSICPVDIIVSGETLYLEANYKIANYTITYNGLENATLTSANPISYNIKTETFTLNNPTKEGFVFSGWTGEGITEPALTVSVAKGSTGNKTYTANWVTAPDYIVGNATITLSNTSFTYNGNVQKPTISKVVINEKEVDISNFDVTWSNESSTNKGDYTVTITGKGNYQGTKTASYSITKASSSVTVNANTLTYNGSAQDLVSVTSNANQTVQYHVTADKYNSVWEHGEFALAAQSDSFWSTTCTATDADKYYVYWRVVGNDNYSGIDADVDNCVIVNISQKNINDVIKAYSVAPLTYNQNNQSPTVTAYTDVNKTNVFSSDYYDVSYTEQSEVGEYDLTITGKGNYTGTINGKWSIGESKDLNNATITIANKKLTYNGSEQYPTVSVSINGQTLANDKYELSYSSTPKNAGTYTVSASGKGDYTGTVSDTFEIVKATNSVSITKAENLKYNGSAQNLITAGTSTSGVIKYYVSANYKYLLDSSLKQVSWSTSIPTGTDTDTYYVYYCVDSDNNYEAVEISTDNYVKVEIAKQNIHLNVEDVYFNNDYQTPNYTVTDDDGRTVDSSHYSIVVVPQKNVGEYTITASSELSANYTGTVSEKWNILKNNQFKYATVEFDDDEYEYTGSAIVPSGITVKLNGDTLTKDIDYTVNVGQNNINVGTYTVTISASGSYSGTISKNYKIVKTTTSADIEGIDNLTYTGEAQTLIKVTEAPKYGAKMQYLLRKSMTEKPEEKDEWQDEIPQATDADTYYVYYRVVGTDNYDGYGGTALYVREVTIAKAKLDESNFVVSIDGVDTNSVVYDGEEHEASVRCVWNGKEVATDQYTVSDDLSTTKATNASDNYFFTISTSTDSNFYVNNALDVQLKYWKIEKRSLSDEKITAKVKHVVYDGLSHSYEDFAVEVKYENQNGKSITLVRGTDYSIEDMAAVSASGYNVTIKAIDGETSNYTGTRTFENAAIIEQAENEVVVESVSGLVYNGEAQEVISKATAKWGTIWYSVDGGIFTESKPKLTNAGTYSIRYKVGSTANYKGVDETISVTIAPAEIQSVSVNGSYTYTGLTQYADLTVRGNNKELSLILGEYEVVSGNTGKDAGDYTVVVKGKGNFTGSASGTWTINKRDITENAIVDLDPFETLTYTGNSQSPTISSVTVGGIQVTYEVVNEGSYTNSAVNAGTYTLKVQGTGNFKGTATKEWTINKAKIQVNGEDISLLNHAYSRNNFTYSGSGQAALLDDKTIVGIEKKTAYFRVDEGEWQTTIPTLVDAGTYKIGYKFVSNDEANDNYEDYGDAVADPIFVTVSRKKLTSADIVIEPEEITYTGFEKTATLSISGLTKGTDYNILNESALKGTDVGEYTVYLTTLGNESKNYTDDILEFKKAWKITAKDLSTSGINVECYPALYTGSELNAADYIKEVTYTSEDGTVTLEKDVDYEVINSTYSTSGVHNVTIKAKSNNYSNQVTFENKFEIKEADVKLTCTSDALTYNANNQTLLRDVAIESLSGGKNLTGSLTIKYSIDGGDTWTTSAVAKNANTYNVMYKVMPGTVEGSYYVGCEGTIQVVINPATIDVISSKSGYVYNGIQQSLEFTVTASGLELNHNDYTVNGYVVGTDAGDYNFTITGKGNYTGSASGTWNIARRDISDAKIITKQLTTKLEYQEDTVQTLDISRVYIVQQLLAKPYLEVTYTVSGNSAQDVGEYTLSVSGTGNYTGSRTLDWEIVKASIKVNGNPISFANKAIKAKDLTYTYEAQELVEVKDNIVGCASESGIEYSLDNKNWSTEIPTATDAGLYHVRYRVKGDDNHSDFGYNVADVVDVYIKQATLDASNFEVSISQSLSGVDTSYSGTTVTYNGYEYKASVSGTFNNHALVEDDDYRIYKTISTLESTHIGHFTICMTTLGCNNNFEDKDITINKYWDIEQAETEVTIVSQDLTYSASGQALLQVAETNFGVIEYMLSSQSGLVNAYTDPRYDNEWSTEIPTAKDAGTYYVYYRVRTNYPYGDWSAVNGCEEVTIKPYDITHFNIDLCGKYALMEKVVEGNAVNQTQEFTLSTSGASELNAADKEFIANVNEYLLNNSNVAAIEGKHQIVIEGHDNFVGTIIKDWGIIGKHINDKTSEFYIGDFEVINNNGNQENEGLRAFLGTTDYKLIGAIASPEDISRMAKGDLLQVLLESKEVDQATIDAIKEQVEATAGSCEVFAYLDITLWKQFVADEEVVNRSQLTNTNGKITIVIQLDDETAEKYGNESRTYKIVRVHKNDDGSIEYELLDAVYDAENKTITFESDKFSYFALAYKINTTSSSTYKVVNTATGIVELNNNVIMYLPSQKDEDDEEE